MGQVAVFDMMSGSSIRALAGLLADRIRLFKFTEAKDQRLETKIAWRR